MASHLLFKHFNLYRILNVGQRHHCSVDDTGFGKVCFFIAFAFGFAYCYTIFRLCEVMELDPVPVIIGIIVHSNIGGALTPISDPISIIISTNSVLSKNVSYYDSYIFLK